MFRCICTVTFFSLGAFVRVASENSSSFDNHKVLETQEEACTATSFIQNANRQTPAISLIQQAVELATPKPLHVAPSHVILSSKLRVEEAVVSKLYLDQKDMWRWVLAAVGLFLCGTVVALRHHPNPQVVSATMAILTGSFYICVSAVMIESNKWLMAEDHFPYPVMLTTNHMLMSCVLANSLRMVSPSSFPAFERLTITPQFCLKFVAIGVPFAVSLMCGNWAYKYLSVSFLQIMKQSNIVTIYVLSVIAGLEALRRCSVVLLVGVMAGAMMAVQGELHFVLAGFMLQACSSVCEATKVIIQGILMSGELKLDPLTLVLFMAPACFLANLVPLVALEGHKLDGIMTRFIEFWPFVVSNACLAFVLNATVAQCIKQLSAVGYLLCGIVKDICIIVTSAWFLGETLSPLQKIGFSIALFCVGLFSLYKQNIGMFADDNLYLGFSNLFNGKSGKEVENPQDAPEHVANAETPPVDSNAKH